MDLWGRVDISKSWTALRSIWTRSRIITTGLAGHVKNLWSGCYSRTPTTGAHAYPSDVYRLPSVCHSYIPNMSAHTARCTPPRGTDQPSLGSAAFFFLTIFSVMFFISVYFLFFIGFKNVEIKQMIKKIKFRFFVI
jgi:hypothetical protein